MNKNVQLNALAIYKVFLAILFRQWSIFIKNKAFIIISIFAKEIPTIMVYSFFIE